MGGVGCVGAVDGIGGVGFVGGVGGMSGVDGIGGVCGVGPPTRRSEVTRRSSWDSLPSTERCVRRKGWMVPWGGAIRDTVTNQTRDHKTQGPIRDRDQSDTLTN